MEGDKRCAYLGRPWDMPDNWGQNLCSTKPDAAHTKGGCIAETDVSWAAHNEFTTVGRVRGNNVEEDAKVAQGRTQCCVGLDW